MIIGISGPIGHGKSTFAQLLINRQPATAYFESSGLISQVADVLNVAMSADSRNQSVAQLTNSQLADALRSVVSFPFDASRLSVTDKAVRDRPDDFARLSVYFKEIEQNPGLLTSPITTANKADYRPFLQWIGSYVTQQLGYSLWYRELIRRAKADSQSLAIIGGVRLVADAIEIRQAGGYVIEIIRPEQSIQDVTDPTETSRSTIVFDSRIINDDSLDALDTVAQTFLHDLRSGQLRSNYKAKAL